MRRAAKLMFFSTLLIFVSFIFSLAVDNAIPMILPILLFFLSGALMVYARLFIDKTSPVKYQDAQISSLESRAARGSLPPQSNIPNTVTLAGQRVRTNELVQPPSVTENTTKLLDNE